MASENGGPFSESYDSDRSMPRSPTRTAQLQQQQEQQPPPPPPLSSYQTASSPEKRGPQYVSANARQPTDRLPSKVQPKPVTEAVNTAFANTKMTSQVSSDLVELITQEVINNLRINGIATGQTSPPKKTSADTSERTPVPPRDLYTPPSPGQEDGQRDRSRPSGLDDLCGDAAWVKITSNKEQRTRERSLSPPPTAIKDPGSRPPPLNRPSTGDATTLEKIWQPLFDKDGQPTARLSQFLRGLAVHLIEDYEPKQSLVITPAKMRKFYEEVSIESEIYPWSSIFGGKMKDSSISHMYRDLKCEHHFVQPRPTDKPTIPGLTPAGLECWMTHVIRAHPDEEFERFAKAALHMPISNFEDPRERFPKELSRRLFPRSPDMLVQETFEDSILADPVIEVSEVRKRPSIASSTSAAAKAATMNDKLASNAPLPPKPVEKSSSVPPPPPVYAANADRQKPSASAPASDTAVSTDASDDDAPQTVQIERERKPYRAQPGLGKVYGDDRTVPSSSASGPTAAAASSLPHRSQTVGTSARPPLDDSLARSGTKARTGSTVNGSVPARRERSPHGAPLHHASTTPSSYQKSEQSDSTSANSYTLHSEGSEDEGGRLRRTQSARNRRSYVPPPSSTKSSGYEDDYYRKGSSQSNASNYGPSSYHPHQSTRY